jgi:hypothetical protein
MNIFSRIFAAIVRSAKSVRDAIWARIWPNLARSSSLGNPVRGCTKPAQPSPEDLARMSHAIDPESFEHQPDQKRKDQEAMIKAAGSVC